MTFKDWQYAFFNMRSLFQGRDPVMDIGRADCTSLVSAMYDGFMLDVHRANWNAKAQPKRAANGAAGRGRSSARVTEVSSLVARDLVPDQPQRSAMGVIHAPMLGNSRGMARAPASEGPNTCPMDVRSDPSHQGTFARGPRRSRRSPSGQRFRCGWQAVDVASGDCALFRNAEGKLRPCRTRGSGRVLADLVPGCA